MSDNNYSGNSLDNQTTAADEPYYQNTGINNNIPQNNNFAQPRPLNKVPANPQPPLLNGQNMSQNSYPHQMNYNNGGMNQAPPVQQTQQFYNQNPNNIPPPYNPPPRQRNNAPAYNNNDNGGKSYGTIILIVITLILILAIIGVGLFLYLRDSDDDDDSSNGKKNRSSSSSYVDEPDSSDEPEDDTAQENTAPTETENKPDSDIISTPNAEGLYYMTAAEMLKEYGFHVDTEFEYSETVSGDIVISQNIPSGTNVENGTRITIIVSQGPEPAQNVDMPNVRGLKYDAAKSQLEDLELNVEFAYEKSSAIAADNVVDQSVTPGTPVKKGTKVTLIISTGKDSQTNSGSYQKGKVVTKETDLNVRKTPSSNGELIGTVAKDSTVEIISEDGNWYKISFKNGFGYVSKDYIQLIN